MSQDFKNSEIQSVDFTKAYELLNKEKVLKLVSQIEDLTKSPSLRSNSSAIQEELLTLKLDLTYEHPKDRLNESKSNHIFKVLGFIQESLQAHSQIKPVVLIMKRLLESHSLNNSWQGGLSSYCLFLLVLAFFKSNLSSGVSYNRLSEWLWNFIFFYAKAYNFRTTMISFKHKSPFIPISVQIETSTAPIIIDPLTSQNAAKNCFRILDIQKELNAICSRLALMKSRNSKEEPFSLILYP